MTRTRKNFRQNSLVGGSNNAGPAILLNKNFNNFYNLRDNLEGMHLESRIDSLLKEIGCESADGVKKTKCLFDFLLNSEGGILPSILLMVKIVKDGGPKTDYKTQLKTFVKAKHPLVIFINTEINIDEQALMNEISKEFQRRVNYTLPESTQDMLLKIRKNLFSFKFEKKESRMNFKTLMSKASFTKTMEGKTYMNPLFSHLLAKKFFVRLSEASDVKKKDRKIKEVANILQLTLKEFLQMEPGTGPGTGPGVDALLHELEGEVALLEMQNAAEQAKMATLQQKLDAAKGHVADAAAREAAEADAGVAQLKRRYDASRKGPKAQGVSKTAKKAKKKSQKLKKKNPRGKKESKKKK